MVVCKATNFFILIFFTIFLLFFFVNFCFSYPIEMTVCAPVANLYKEPGFDVSNLTGPLLSRNVFGLETQLIFGEFVIAFEEKTINDVAWVRVVSQEQKKITEDFSNFFHSVLDGYQGWVLASNLIPKKIIDQNEHYSWQRTPFFIKEPWVKILCGDREELFPFGTKVFVEKIYAVAKACDILLSDGRQGLLLGDVLDSGFSGSLKMVYNHILRNKLVCNAKSFLGMPYVWGGCSPFLPDAGFLTGVDCSGLIYLCYRVCGCEIPRDAHDQFCLLSSVEPKSLKIGDLVFFGKERSLGEKEDIFMNHVAMYIGDEMFIQARGNQYSSDIFDMDQVDKDKLCVCISSSEELFGKPVYELQNGEEIFSSKIFVFFRTYFA